MIRHPRLSVEIFRDSITPNVPTDSVEHGIELLTAIAPCVRLERNSRTMRTLVDNAEYIRTDLFVPPRISADLGVLVTGRSLVDQENLDEYGNIINTRDENGLMTVGIAYNMNCISSPKIAIVSVGPAFDELSADSITEHELTHLLNVKNDGESHDGYGHCIDVSCIMSAIVLVMPTFLVISAFIATFHVTSLLYVARSKT